MEAIRQRCMPKHQVLIHKCYPRYQKSAQEVRANSSELSYLLYYASTRRSKLTKVCSYLEKTTATDVNKNRTGNISVTLEIAKSLIEKTPRDLPLYATYILHILMRILQSKDLPTIEESVPVFEAFCNHNYAATFAGEQKYIEQYEEVITTYASYAALKLPVQPKGGLNAPMAVRWRIAGLKAMKCATASEALGVDNGPQMNPIMTAILQNLHAGDGHDLVALQRRSTNTSGEENDNALRRRMSVATVRTENHQSRPTTAEVEGAGDDADRIAEEEVGLLALQGLKQIFTAKNRGQIRIATDAMLNFICSKAPDRRPATTTSTKSLITPTWANTLLEMVTLWTPVQDRFMILITIVEYLVRSPVTEEGLEQQLTLVSLIDWLLRSNINMIGLSVIDILFSLVQQILVNLQLHGEILPTHTHTNAIDLFKGSEKENAPDGSATKATEDETLPSSNRQLLLSRLQKCIGNLAVHIYYSDQVSDIITAILLRLRPSISTATSIDQPHLATKSLKEANTTLNSTKPTTNSTNPTNPTDHSQTKREQSEFFSFGTARVTALKAIKEVLIMANIKGSGTTGPSMGRSRVGAAAWEGTQWLLRDEDRRVRRAYVDALQTWLKYEMSPHDLRVVEDKPQRTPSKKDARPKDDMSRKALTTIYGWEEDRLREKSEYLQLLHLAIYENALEASESESDILLLHLLLYHLVEKLGVNAAKTGLPMILRLQEDINIDEKVSTPQAKINLGCLVHGYLWTLSEWFDFTTSTVGFVVQSEIQRRKKHGIWLENVQVPPVPLERIMTASSTASRFDPAKPSLDELQKESIRPFDSRTEMVERIAQAYIKETLSPPSSPPASPGRIFSIPILATDAGLEQTAQMPDKIKQTMLSEWSREICLARTDSHLSHSERSRRSTNLVRNFEANFIRDPSPKDAAKRQAGNHPNGLNFDLEKRRSSKDTDSPSQASTEHAVLRVEDLKRILAGGPINGIRTASPLRHSTKRSSGYSSHQKRDSTASESVVTAASGFESADEGDVSKPLPASIKTPITAEPAKPATTPPAASSNHSRNPSVTSRSRPQSGEQSAPRSLRRPSTSSSAAGEDPDANAAALRGEMPRPSGEYTDVPPVPPLPATIPAPSRPLSQGLPARDAIPMAGRGEKGQKRKSEGGKGAIDVDALLGSIDAVSGRGGGRLRRGGRGGMPPY